MDKDMITSGVKPVPRKLFLWGQCNRSGRPRNRDSESIRIHLLPGGEATVSPKGIRFKGQFYTCPKAEEENWRFIARNKGTWKVEIAFDPRVPEIIYLRPKSGSPSIPCYLMNPESIAIGSDWAEVEEYYERKQVDDEFAKVWDMQSRTELDSDVENIVSQAKQMFDEACAQTPAGSNRSRLNGMSERKQAEIELMAQEYRSEILEQAGILNANVPQIDNSGDSDNSGEGYVPRPRLSNVLSIQERKMKQHDKGK